MRGVIHMISKFAPMGVLLAAIISSSATAQTALDATPQDSFKYLSAAAEAQLLNKPGPGPIVSMLSDHEYYLSEIVTRKVDGQVEVHQHWIDFMTVLSGTATLTYGDVYTGAKQTAPGEMRGGTIVKGKTINLHPGDYVEIPAGTAHLMTSPAGDFRYLVVKVRI